MRLTKIFSVSFMCSLFFLSVLGVAGQYTTALKFKAEKMAYETETEIGPGRGDTLWKNEFASDYGLPSVVYLQENADTGKSCILADDFTVTAGEIWTLDTILTYLFARKRLPDSVRVIIYKDGGGFPDETNIVKNFTKRITNMSAFPIKVAVKAQNIVLQEGIYWISFMGEYKQGFWPPVGGDTAITYWIYKDSLLISDYGMCITDSLGIMALQPPLPWVTLEFDPGILNSTRFSLKGTKAVAINTNNKPKSLVSGFAFPNPASDNITFQLNNPAVRYIQIYDMKGKLLQTVSAKTNRKKVHLNALTNGIYMYQLLDASKKSVDRGRFSVSK